MYGRTSKKEKKMYEMKLSTKVAFQLNGYRRLLLCERTVKRTRETCNSFSILKFSINILWHEFSNNKIEKKNVSDLIRTITSSHIYILHKIINAFQLKLEEKKNIHSISIE